jgi:hypothetical protein
MNKLAIVIALSSVLAAPMQAGAQGQGGKREFVRSDLMNGYQEAPPISTTGFGEFRAQIDDEAQMIRYELTYAGLEGGATLFAHIHFGQRGVSGGVSAFLCGGGDKPPCPPVEGTVTGVIDPTDVIGPGPGEPRPDQGIEPGSFAELVRAMRIGSTYVNVHTTRWPGGEIRGQVADQNQREPRGTSAQ